MEKKKIALYWMRRDLRWEDNRALYESLLSDLPVLPLFIFDRTILDVLPENDARVSFFYERLAQLMKDHEIDFYCGDVMTQWESIVEKYDVEAVYWNRDYSPYARERDAKVYSFLQEKGITVHTYKDHVIFERSEVVKDDGKPYSIYTPYMKKWRTLFDIDKDVENYTTKKGVFFTPKKDSLPQLSDMGFVTSRAKAPKMTVAKEVIEHYGETRDFPAQNGTSYIGAYLRFGFISTREMIRHAYTVADDTFFKELIWRDFFQQILWHFPETTEKSFRPAYDEIVWNNDSQDFAAWKEGRTGYPFVDAGMRELNATGYMHNRVRMVVASFLCKHLLIDWRWGERYFAEKLFDYEIASNVGNWQWASGSGCDAAPYFRIFNPETQMKKFDPDMAYVKKWVPEYGLPTYPEPIVEHRFARKRVLAAYKKALQK